MNQNKFSRYSAYETPGADFLWHIIIYDIQWFDTNKDILQEWFNYNIPSVIFQSVQLSYMFSLKSEEEFLLWKLAWDNI